MRALRIVTQEVDLESQILGALNSALSYGQRKDEFMKDVMMRKFEWLHAQRTRTAVRVMERAQRIA